MEQESSPVAVEDKYLQSSLLSGLLLLENLRSRKQTVTWTTNGHRFLDLRKRQTLAQYNGTL